MIYFRRELQSPSHITDRLALRPLPQPVPKLHDEAGLIAALVTNIRKAEADAGSFDDGSNSRRGKYGVCPIQCG